MSEMRTEEEIRARLAETESEIKHCSLTKPCGACNLARQEAYILEWVLEEKEEK